MPSGLYRGTVMAVQAAGVTINIPRFGDTLWGPVEIPPGETFATGDVVLCGFFEGLHSQLEVIRKATTPVPNPEATYTSTYGGSY